MEELLIQPKSEDKIEEVIVYKEGFTNLKDVLTWSKNYKDKKVILLVPVSRYLKILSDYWSVNAIQVEGNIERYLNYSYYYLTDLDKSGNAFKIVRTKVKEVKGKCEGCNCDTKKWMNPSTNICYYKEMITNDYYTPKIKLNGK